MHAINRRPFIAAMGVVTAFLTFLPSAGFAQAVLPEGAPVAGTPRLGPTTEEVTSFASDITIRRDGVVTVVERIDYDFPKPGHGILRDIPLMYVRGDEGKVRILVENVRVSGAPFIVEGSRNALRIRIGDADAPVSGPQTYVISYELHGALVYGETRDALVLDVTGDGWEVPLRRVSAVVHLPDGVEDSTIAFRCFTGGHGSADQDCLYDRMANDVHFVAEGSMTVEAEWGPTGLVARIDPEHPLTGRPFFPAVMTSVIIIVSASVFLLMRRHRRKGAKDARRVGNPGIVADDDGIRRILRESKVIAAVGLSSKPERPSHGVCGFLKSHGYRVIPVNPNETEVLGEKSYPDLRSVPVPVDIVQIFRDPQHVPPIVRDAIAIGAKVVWMQDGAGNPEAAKEAEKAGLTVVVDDCMLRRYRQLIGK